MSAYSSELTAQGVAKAMKKVVFGFPKLPIEFHSVLKERVKELGIGDDRLMDAVNHVIDNCIYPEPTIAQFLSFDSRIKLYDYNQYVELNNQLSGLAGKHYKSIEVPGQSKPMWAKISDIEKFKLKLFKPKN
tara:strand:- start:66 stop:461 length:396 start_codon:yes stop_codon:yes gene_type:complete